MTVAALLAAGRAALGVVSGVKLWLIAGGLVAVVVGALWIWNAKLRAELRLATVIASDNAKVIRLMKADQVQSARLARELREEKRTLEEKYNDDVRRIYAAGRSTACVSSPSWRAFIEGAGPVPAAPAAGGPAGGPGAGGVRKRP